MPHNVAVSLLCPHKGTEVYDQIKDRILHHPEEVEYGYWHQTEMWRHDRYSFEELQAARDQLIERHRRECTGPMARLRRKSDRLNAMIRHPELLGDLLEIRKRKKEYQRRVASWMRDGKFDVDSKFSPASAPLEAPRARETVSA
jgi:hypothetical protein